jgi:UDP-glucose 4-epimerase
MVKNSTQTNGVEDVGRGSITVLITGGLGVNGAVTARLLVHEGLRPILMDNRRDLSLVADIKDSVEIVVGDIGDQVALEGAVSTYGVTHIAHLAALMPDPSEANPRLAQQVGVGGTLNVLEVARTAGIERVVFTSSKAVYGAFEGEYAPPTCTPLAEDHPKRPFDLYGSLKVCCEELGRYYRESHGLDFVALRFASIYAPGKEARHGAYSFYGQVIEKARSGEPWVIHSGDDQLNDAVYVGDVARAIHAALTAPPLTQWILNIGTGTASTPEDFLNAAALLFPDHAIQLGEGPSAQARSSPTYCVFDIAAARREIGYEPAFSVELGVRDYVATLERLGR